MGTLYLTLSPCFWTHFSDLDYQSNPSSLALSLTCYCFVHWPVNGWSKMAFCNMQVSSLHKFCFGLCKELHLWLEAEQCSRTPNWKTAVKNKNAAMTRACNNRWQYCVFVWHELRNYLVLMEASLGFKPCLLAGIDALNEILNDQLTEPNDDLQSYSQGLIKVLESTRLSGIDILSPVINAQASLINDTITALTTLQGELSSCEPLHDRSIGNRHWSALNLLWCYCAFEILKNFSHVRGSVSDAHCSHKRVYFVV